ncbi:hypothetical protein PIB30_010359 [Stylosanthes scabra]|uniref:Replication protein A 70 kDa DNA-binding subunit B/D first OB fold domain-containing protein n=1 Tax=Stylosanthes scabra TaxID=79078 RepID=A0ABU6W8K4_9FABA|nr:hypothetical protein [Stylosanthes scabra]
MTTNVDPVKDVSVRSLNEDKVWKIKVRILRLWKVNFGSNNNIPMIEMVVIDEKCDRISCTIKSYHARLFQHDLIKGKTCIISNFSVEENKGKYRATLHPYKILFKKDTKVRMINENNIPLRSFNFIPHADIPSHTEEQSHLIGELIKWSKDDRNGQNIALDLHDIQPQSVSLSEDFLIRTEYRSISQLKDVIEKSTYVTIGTVVDFTPGKSWWYMGCKSCKLGLKKGVVDETDIASFIIYEIVGDAFLGITADNLRSTHLLKGGGKNDFLKELNAFIGKRFLFKVTVKLENINAFQPVSISVVKLCDNESIIRAFAEKYNIDNGSQSQVSETKPIEESSEFITPAHSEEKHITCTNFDDSLQDDTLTPSKSRGKEKLKKNPTEFYANDEVADVNIDDKRDGVALCAKQPSKEYNLSSTKMRNVKKKIKEDN